MNRSKFCIPLTATLVALALSGTLTACAQPVDEPAANWAPDPAPCLSCSR